MPAHRPPRAVPAADVPPDAFIVDVREGEEWATAHVADSVHIPMMTVPGRLPELPVDRTIWVLCAVGARSAQVAAWLTDQGYDAVNIDGGINAWVAGGRPTVSGD